MQSRSAALSDFKTAVLDLHCTSATLPTRTACLTIVAIQAFDESATDLIVIDTLYVDTDIAFGLRAVTPQNRGALRMFARSCALPQPTSPPGQSSMVCLSFLFL
jgi:hypothetical protein